MGEAAEWQACQGFLFKLKENHKEWKKLYVVLDGGSIVYYDSPLGERERERDPLIRRGLTQHASRHIGLIHRISPLPPTPCALIQVRGPTASSRTV